MSQTVANPPTGALLTVAPQTFVDANGDPLALGSVTTYVAGTTVLATTWQDPYLTIPNTNPITLSAAGSATIWGLGNYTLVSQDSAGNQINSQEVSGGISSLTLDLAGTANTYTVSVPGLVTTGLTNPLGQLSGIPLYLVANVTNTGATTVNFNGLGTTPVQYPSGAALTGGELPSGAYTLVIYNPTAGALQLVAASTSAGSNIPGEIRAYGGTSAPSGWALCYGQAVSRTAYPSTFAAIGTAWGAGNGSTTYNLPDLRGRGLFGADAMGGSAADRLTSASLGGTGVTASLFAVMGNPVTIGGVTTYSITQVGISNPGSGYTSIPGVSVSASTGSGANITATILNGVVNTITLNSGGSGYPATVQLVCGAPSSSTTAIVGATGGNELTQQHLHVNTVSDPGHVHWSVSTPLDVLTDQGGGTGNFNGVSGNDFVGANFNTATTGITLTNVNYGGGNSQNLPPAAVVSWIIALS